ncbi:MAG TPA: hypothetical protein VMU59_00760 [Caulobacteraceae bacterium]|nr:hypothetical protein [Caulobacteraceae bacterium]
MANRLTTMTATALAATGLLLCACDGSSAWAPARLGFYFNQDGQDANLAYGAANSDDVGLMLQCAKGSHEVELTDVASAKDDASLVLASGDRRLVAPARISVDETGAPLAQTDLPVDSPVLQGFRDSGAIAVSLGRSHYALRARREEAAAVSSFFSACEKS